MGVQGWTKILRERGVLPEAAGCCSTELWRSKEADDDDVFSSIESGSCLHVDGNGLVFFLYRVAYARHMEAVLRRPSGYGEPSKTARKPCSQSLKSLSPETIRELIPTFLPLALLQSVTAEFVKTLTQFYGLELVIYWDGPRKPIYKSRTTEEKRISRREVEWSNLRSYCDSGILPSQKICEWEALFPRHRLASCQVQHTLHKQCRLRRVDCPGEADDFLARSCRDRERHYVLGEDSDFSFLPGIAYVPLTTLAATPSGLKGAVLKRSELAEIFQMPDEAALVEVAICLGNDFIPRQPMVNTDTAVEHVRSRGKGFRVPATHLTVYNHETNRKSSLGQEEVELAMDFVRRWYNFDEIPDHELVSKEDAVFDGDDEEEAGDIIHRNTEDVEETEAPKIPMIVDFELLRLRLLNDSIKSAVLRSLQAHLDHNPLELILQQKHIDLFQNMSKIDPPNMEKVAGFRLRWEDVVICRWIEQIVSTALKVNQGHPLSVLFPASSVFDSHAFLQILAEEHEDETPNDADEDGGQSVNTVPLPRPNLPIDEHQEKIVETIRQNRVTIIQGETGCGKSSRIPVMLLEAPSPDPAIPRVKMFISQPRRIAAKALVERVRAVEPDLREAIALRMGHGVKEYENSKTQAWFVTTGYLVRLLANHPERFNDVTHIIVDECHERSIDTDLLCLLCRRLLATNNHIRLVLMSATLAASLYQTYFGLSHPVIKVGAKRFPIEEVYLEDLKGLFKFPAKDKRNIDAIVKECTAIKCTRPPSASYMEKVYSVVAYLATVVSEPGSAVLVFVPGMNDIIAITELIEQLVVPDVEFKCFPVHGDIPFDDQMDVFKPSGPGEVKIIIATNAAESSVTLPDCDHVICLGLCKQIVYNETSHRQMLLPTWISRASATQRAGRTSRVRPGGRVYRLYTRDIFNFDMDEFEPGEMLRVPLDSVILMLKQILHGEAVTDALLDCLEPPNLSTIERSFAGLHRSHFITSPDENCEITTLGKFVSALGIDLMLGSLIGLGIQFGVGAEAIDLAAVLSFPKTPWIISNALIHEPSEFNEQMAKCYVSRCHFDANLYSEPLGVMNLLWEWKANSQNTKWCRQVGVFLPRIRRLDHTICNLRSRVAGFLAIPSNAIAPSQPPVNMPHSKVTILRIIQAWVFNDAIIQCQAKNLMKNINGDTYTVDLQRKSDAVEKEHLFQVLSEGRHAFELKGFSKTEQKGIVRLIEEGAFSVSIFEERLLSYCSEYNLSLAWYSGGQRYSVYVRADMLNRADFALVLDALRRCFSFEESILIVPASGGSHRGVAERPCGRWKIDRGSTKSKKTMDWVRFETNRDLPLKKKQWKFLKQQISDFMKLSLLMGTSISLTDASGGASKALSFSLESFGFKITERDLKDLLSSPHIETSSTKKVASRQRIQFAIEQSGPSKSIGTVPYEETSWSKSPIEGNIPEGARILSVIASDRRREHLVRLGSGVKDEEGDSSDSEIYLDMHLDQQHTKISLRWKRFGTDRGVYVNPNSVPASAIPLRGHGSLFCVCANTLEVGGGGVRAEGLTLMPQGRLFLKLCQLTFDLCSSEALPEQLEWIAEDFDGPRAEDEWQKRIDAAVAFNKNCSWMGEELECFPSQIAELLCVFNGVDGHELGAWLSLPSDPFISTNRGKYSVVKPFDSVRRSEAEATKHSQHILDDYGVASNRSSNKTKRTQTKKKKGKKDDTSSQLQSKVSESCSMDGPFDPVKIAQPELSCLSFQLLGTSSGVHVNEASMPSSNILAMVVEEVRKKRGDTTSEMSLGGPDWSISEVVIGGQSYFRALFHSLGLPLTRQVSKKKKAWIKERSPGSRPTSLTDASDCVPPPFQETLEGNMALFSHQGFDVIIFTTVEMAVRMEAAFWLERQFSTVDRHWYRQNIEYMLNRLETSLQC